MGFKDSKKNYKKVKNPPMFIHVDDQEQKRAYSAEILGQLGLPFLSFATVEEAVNARAALL